MKLQTRNFGIIEFDESKQIIFPEGIPGFKELKDYIIIEDEDKSSPFSYLQSIEDGSVSFIVINPYLLKEDYLVNISDSYIEILGEGNQEDFDVFAIVTLTEDFQKATVNLLAPIIVQNKKRKGIQVILDKTSYTTRHKIVELLNERS